MYNRLGRKHFDFIRVHPADIHKHDLTWDEQIPSYYANRRINPGDVKILEKLQDAVEPGYLYAFNYLADAIDWHFFPLGFVLVRLWVSGKIKRAYGAIQRQGDGPMLRDGKRHFVYYYIGPKAAVAV
jgi:hypothetical protein